MANWKYSAFTLLGILMIGGALALQILYVKNNQNSDDYFPHQMAAVAMDTLVVLYLMYMLVVYRPYASNLYSGIAVSLLMIGLGVEIFGTQFNITESTAWLSYLLATTNSLIRLYILIQTRCDAAASTVGEITKEIVKVAKDSGKPVADVAKAVSVPLGTLDPLNVWQKFTNVLGSISLDDDKTKDIEIKRKLKDEARTKVFGLEPKEPKGGRRH